MSEAGNASLFLTNYFKTYIQEHRKFGLPINDLYKQAIYMVDKCLILSVLDDCKGSKKEAAKILGLSRNTLMKKMKVLNIDVHKDL